MQVQAKMVQAAELGSALLVLQEEQIDPQTLMVSA
jgi:hypothetical protein